MRNLVVVFTIHRRISMQLISASERIVIPLDKGNVGEALSLARLLSGKVGCFKVGLELIHAILASILCPVSPAEVRRNLDAVRELFDLLGTNLFWDGKFCDISNTVGGATVQVNRIGVKWLNVHASAGRAAIRAAVEKATNCKVLGVTVLTSLDSECVSIFGDEAPNKVLAFADMLLEEGAAGAISSPSEVPLLRAESRFDKLTLVTPNVRPKWAPINDQSKNRSMTPGEAIAAGVDYLVIGRPISQPPAEIGGPLEAVRLITEEIEQAIIRMAA